MSLDAATDIAETELARLAADLLGEPVAAVTRVPGGGNNRLYRVDRQQGGAAALKQYPVVGKDHRDRLGAEYGGLSFLARHRVGGVPAPLACDAWRQLALYEWIDGAAVEAVDDADIDAALALVTRLYELTDGPEAEALPLASEACLSPAELTAQVQRRFDRLTGIMHDGLAELIVTGVAPAVERVRTEAEAACDAAGIAFDAPLSMRWQTLSPSDFGFHNALRRPDGGIAFVDFEYFGRDDPVKLTADFLLHPGMRLDDGQRRRFLAGCRAIFAADRDYRARLRALYPLYALRWSLILLNEFLPERWARRSFAMPEADHRQRLDQQLAKARAMLRRVDDINGSLFSDA